ncbi:MAG: patatin-like phospholipase family protein, partial [Spirochaetaceae bacterium]|nr:patatin-like phospholipase family protein [Spirochaetaceae bacterium]
VWRALQELGVPVNAFIGNSIGAIISAFLAQGLYTELEEIGDTIGIDTIMNLPDELVEEGRLQIDRTRLAAVRRFSKNTLERRAIDTSPLRSLVYDRIDEDKIRRSGIDLAVVTFNVSDLKPREVFIEEMEHGQLREYILASAAFPGFDQPVIEGKKHIDGGVYNNLPYNLAISRGYKNIIVVDVSGIGVNRRINTKGTNTIYIKNSVDIGGVLSFDRETLNRLRTLGYLDTMKALGRVVGNRYFVDLDEGREQKFGLFLARKFGPRYRARIAELKVLPPSLRHERHLLYPLLDSTASAMRLDRVKRYSYLELCEAIVRVKSRIDRNIEAIAGDEERRRFMKVARQIRRGRRTRGDLARSPYYYS